MATLREDTLELRWLFDGASPRAVRDWFGADEAPEERVDHYLLLPEAHELGIKLRDGRFEAKGRVGPPEAVDLGAAQGVLEAWTKWSVEDAGSVAPSRALASAAAPTVGISKVRRRRAFGLDGVEVPVVVAPTPAFLAELTDLRVEDRSHWTLGVEITARGEGRRAALCRFAAAWLAGFPVALRAEHASSYAALVARQAF